MNPLNRGRFASWLVMSLGPAAALSARAKTILPLTPVEVTSLKFTREEEQIGRDFYRALCWKWNSRLSHNISRSESRHFEAVGVLLNRREIAIKAAYTNLLAFSLNHRGHSKTCWRLCAETGRAQVAHAGITYR